jgi:hypothetical protein
MDKWAPRDGGVRKPTDSSKKNGMFNNYPRFLKFGGPRGNGVKLDQSGTTKPDLSAGNAVGPISDRGKGRR